MTWGPTQPLWSLDEWHQLLDGSSVEEGQAMFEELSMAFASDPDWISYIKATKEKLNEGRITPGIACPGGVRMRITKDRVMVGRMN